MSAAEGHDGDVGTLLAVFAHPDDEAYLVGGLMAVAADAGRRVVCVTATRGELGFPDDDPRSLDERAAVREAELRACLEVLGVTEHHWLEQPDGRCHVVDDAAPVDRLRAIIDEIRPDTVATFGPDGQTLHPDHIAVSRWTTLAVRAASVAPDLLYAVMTPEWVEEFSQYVPMDEVMMVPGAEPPTVPEDELDLWFVCDDELAARKVRALRCQVSQTTGLIDMVGEEAYRRLVRDEMFRRPTHTDWQGAGFAP
jgi:LmbE family N-acetylglucosaminyl deacetylase